MDILTLLEYVKKNGRATVAEVRQKFGVGYIKARTLFEELEKKGLVKIEGSGFVYCGKEETDDDDEEEEGEETDIDDYIANLKRRLMQRMTETSSETDGPVDDAQEVDDESEDEEDSEDDPGDIEDGDDIATSLSSYIEATRRNLESYKANAQASESEDEGEDDEKDEDEEPVSELEERADREREPLIDELDRLFDEGEATGAAITDDDLQKRKQDVIGRLMKIEGEAVAEGSEGGKARRVGFRHFIVALIDEISVEEHEYYDEIKADISYPDATPYEISLMFDHYLTDNGKTLEYLAGNMDVSDEKVVAEIRRTAASHSAELVGNELIARIPSNPFTALVDFMRFVVAIEAVCGICF